MIVIAAFNITLEGSTFERGKEYIAKQEGINYFVVGENQSGQSFTAQEFDLFFDVIEDDFENKEIEEDNKMRKIHYENARVVTDYYINEEARTVVCIITAYDDVAAKLAKYGLADDNIVIVEKKVYRGVAKCSPADVWDEKVGMRLAEYRASRARAAYVNEQIDKFISDNERRLKNLRMYGRMKTQYFSSYPNEKENAAKVAVNVAVDPDSKNVIMKDGVAYCPGCAAAFHQNTSQWGQTQCKHCGQKLKWE